MYTKFITLLNELYKDDFKKLRTGTVLYGHLFEGRWQTIVNKSLSPQEIKEFEEEKGKLPREYKEMLRSFNGIYLFDLIHIAGKTKSSLKGLSIEEQNHEPASLEDVVPYLRKKKLPENIFPFGTSMINDSFYAFAHDGKVLELDDRKLKVINEYDSLEHLLNAVFKEGTRMVKNGEYIEFS